MFYHTSNKIYSDSDYDSVTLLSLSHHHQTTVTLLSMSHWCQTSTTAQLCDLTPPTGGGTVPCLGHTICIECHQSVEEMPCSHTHTQTYLALHTACSSPASATAWGCAPSGRQLAPSTSRRGAGSGHQGGADTGAGCAYRPGTALTTAAGPSADRAVQGLTMTYLGHVRLAATTWMTYYWS